jgi:hypothetical protein
MDQEFLNNIQNFIANNFSISTIRKMAGAGALKRIQRFMKEDIDLGDLSKSNPSQYGNTLNVLTTKLLIALPEPDRAKWGLARKCLNLFFRDALYNFYLREAYDLGKFEAELEIPLDSHVGKELRQRDRALPGWKSVIGLTPDQSAKFQESALRIARRESTHRVHLDVVYWRGSR